MLYADDATISASGKRIVDNENTLSDSGTSLSTTKILVIHFDNVMSWDDHIKAIRKLFVNSYILPHIDYCCAVWGNCSITLVTSLEKNF